MASPLRLALWLTALTLTILPAAAAPGGSAAGATDVRLPSMAIGKTYSTWRLSQSPFVVHNTSGDTLIVTVQIGLPTRLNVRPGAQPLPDPSWVRLDIDCLVVPPHSTRRTDVHLSLPYDPDLAGNTYQVNIWSSQVRSGRPQFAVRQCHCILFRAEMDYRDDTATDFASRFQGQHHRCL
jgi:hypothetical protein